MKQIQVAGQLTRRQVLAAAGTAFVLAACGKTNTVPARGQRMGEKVNAGKLIYNVLHAQWKPALGEGANQRVPKNRFLILDITITNSSGEEAGVPLLNLYNAGGQNYLELDNGEGLENWLGLLRPVKPVQTIQGSLLFDVPQTSYKLQVTDGGESGSELFAYIDIPLQIDSDDVLSVPPAIQKNQ